MWKKMTSCNCGCGGREEGKGKGLHFCLKLPIWKEVWEPYDTEWPKYDEKGNYAGTEKITMHHTVKKLYWKCTHCGRGFPSSYDDEDNNERNWRFPLRLGKKCSRSDY